MCFCLLCACGNGGLNGADSASGSETDDSYNENIIYDEIDDYKRKVYSDTHDRCSKSSKVSYEDYVVDGRDVAFLRTKRE